MAVQAQLYSDNVGFPLCGSFDLIDNGRGVGAGAGFGLSVHQLSHLQQLKQQQQQFQYLQNQEQRNQNLESMVFSQNMVSQVEVHQFIKSQNERLRLLVQEQRKQQLALMAKKMESRACVLLNQKEQEIAKANNKAMELQNLLGRLEMEGQEWQRVAQENEAMVLSLNNRLERLREQAYCRFNNSVDDAESCCECVQEENNNNNNSVFPVDQRKELDEEERTMVCKCCYRRGSCVLFLPCRHLCSCKDCAVFLDSCPVCKTAKKGSIEALFS